MISLESSRIAKQIVNEGYQMIELCGGFGPEWIDKVTKALDNEIPVGGVFYGPQFRQTLADLFKEKINNLTHLVTELASRVSKF